MTGATATRRGKVDLDATRERLIRLGLAHAAEHVGEQLAQATKEELAPHRFLDGLLEVATAILDRLLHRSQVLNISGRSYRLRDLEQAARASRGS